MIFNLPQKINKVEILNCNNNCLFCDIKERKKLNTDDIKKIIKFGKKGNDILHFCNGEVAIRDDFVELINYGQELGYQIIQIETNGRIFYYSKFVEKNNNLGIDKFIVKIYSNKKEIHEGITKIHGSFEQTMQGIKNLIKNHKYVSIDFIIGDFNYQKIPEIIEFLANLKINEINFKIIKNFHLKDNKIIEKAELICANYGILTNRVNILAEEFNKTDLTNKEQKIEEKIKYLWDQDIKFIDFKLRKKIFKDLGLIEILEYLRNKANVIFHSSYDKFDKLIPHKGDAIYYHGNFNAIYAQDDPYEAVLRAIKNKSNKKLGFCACKKTNLIDNKFIYRFFAEKKVRNNLSNGYIHVINNHGFFYNRHEYYSFSSIIPLLIFEVEKADFQYEVEPYPFIETERSPTSGPFQPYERDLVREICLNKYESFKYDKQHSFEHVYRVSEIAFSLGLNECPEFANQMFIGACLHDIGRVDDSFELQHGPKGEEIAKQMIKKYFADYYNKDILRAIREHSDGATTANPLLGCIFDADRIDLIRMKKIPRVELLSTKTAKTMLHNLLISHKKNIQILFDNWDLHLDYFRKFLDNNQIILPSKFFKKINKEKFKDLGILLNKNYNDLGELTGIYKYTKHSCNKIHLFVFNNKKAIVKFTDRSDEDILFEKYLIDLLKDKINLPVIFMTKDNSPFISYNKGKVVLTEFIAGQGINFNQLENDVIQLLKTVYLNGEKIAKKYQELLPRQFKAKFVGLKKKDIDLIKDKKIRECLKDDWDLIEKQYDDKRSFVPAFKGLQIVNSDNKNYFLGTEHLYELYVPIYQAIVNCLVNLIYLTRQDICIEQDIYLLFNKFEKKLEIEKLRKEEVKLFFYLQYMIFMKNKDKEDKRLFNIWRKILIQIK